MEKREGAYYLLNNDKHYCRAISVMKICLSFCSFHYAVSIVYLGYTLCWDLVDMYCGSLYGSVLLY